MMRIDNLLVGVAGAMFLTSSFDVFLNIDAGPNIRAAQLLAVILVAAAFALRRSRVALELPLGSRALLAWFCLQLAFIPVADFWLKSLAYCVWLALNIGLLFALVNLFSGDAGKLQRLLKLYLLSYVFVACFGIAQFLLPLLGGPALLVQQWWIRGSIPRVNGFSFEPSYFATYLIMGLVTLGSLRRSHIEEFRTLSWTAAYLAMIVAMLVCFSRMGLVFLFIELAITPAKRLWRIATNPKLILRFRIRVWKLAIAGTAVALIYAGVNGAIDWYRNNPQTVAILVAGTGLLGTATHSVDEREDHLQDTLRTIADHPWIGRGLGGVTESVAGYVGVTPMNFEETKNFEGQSVFAEVIAASGIPGSIPFFLFVAATLIAPMQLARRAPPLQAAWLRALVVSLLLEWGILQLNQNVLRLYLWVHIGVLVLVYAHVRRQYGEPCEPELAAGGYESPNLLA